MSQDLVEYLRARLDEEERFARTAGYPDPERWVAEVDRVLNAYLRPTATAWKQEAADHIAYWDPARVLADIEAKRRIVDRFVALLEYAARPYDKPEHAAKRQPYLNALEDVIRDLVQPYSSRPDFNEDWRTP